MNIESRIEVKGITIVMPAERYSRLLSDEANACIARTTRLHDDEINACIARVEHQQEMANAFSYALASIIAVAAALIAANGLLIH